MLATRNRSGQRPKDPIYRRLLANMDAGLLRNEAKAHRDEWAPRGLKLSEAGQVKQAQVASRKAEFWDTRLKKLECRVD